MNATPLNVLGFFLVLFSFGCSDSVQHLSKGTDKSPVPGTLKRILHDSSGILQDKFHLSCSLQEFYTLRHYQPVWLRNAGFTPQVDTLIRIIRQSAYLGLIPEDYHFETIQDLVRKSRQSSPSDTAVAQLDLYLSDAFFTLALHVRDGRTESQAVSMRQAGTIDSLLYEPLVAAISRNSIKVVLESLEPSQKKYKMLKRHLKSKLDSISLGSNDGLTLQRLETQARILSINMERWKWESRDSVQRYLMVNIPAFRLEVRDRDNLEFESPVIVGTPWSPTPVLDASLINLIVHPTWNVPRSIATRELLPRIKSDSTYLSSHNFKILDISGGEVHPDSVAWDRQHSNYFPYMLQQQPGTFNALGLVKFTFTNDFNIYLHDTNTKKYFEYPRRALSHGCVRVERARELADYLVRDENPYCTPKELENFFDQGKLKQVNFNPLSIRIRYFTSDSSENGEVYFHDDIYGYDRPLMELIYCRHPAKSVTSWLAVNVVQQGGEADACL